MNKANRKKLIFGTVFCFFFYFAQSVARCVYGTLSPFLVDYYDTSLTESSLFSMAENIGFIVIMLLVTVIADRIDKAYLLLGLCSVYGVILLIMGTAPSFILLLVLLFITGILGRYVDTTCTAYISDLYGDDRAKYMSWLLVIFYTGSTLSPNLNTLLIETLGKPWNTTYTVSGILMTGGVILYVLGLIFIGKPATVLETKKDENKPQKKVTVRDLIKNRNMAVLFFSNIVIAGSNYFGGQLILYLSMTDSILYDTATRGFIATAGSLGLVVGSALYLWISRRMSANRYLAMETLIAFAFNLAGLIINRPIPWMIFKFLSSAIGGGSFTARTLLCCEEFPECSSSAIALVSLASGISSIFATPLLNALADATSFSFSMKLSLFFNFGAWALLRFAYKPHAPKEAVNYSDL